MQSVSFSCDSELSLADSSHFLDLRSLISACAESSLAFKFLALAYVSDDLVSPNSSCA